MATTASTPLTSRRDSNRISLNDSSALLGDPKSDEPAIKRALHNLEMRVAQVRASMHKLRELADVSPSELTSGFDLMNQSEGDKFEEERAKIRVANVEEARKLAERYLISYSEMARRNGAQRRRMDTLESRTTRMETLFSEQIQLNQEIGDEAVQALSNFADAEKRRIVALENANARNETMRAEMNKVRERAELLEDSNREMKALMDEFTKEKCEIARKLLDCQNDCHKLRMANDQMRHDMEVQGRMLEAKEAQSDELKQREEQYRGALAEKERNMRRMEEEMGNMRRQMEEEQERHREELDKAQREGERKMDEDKIRMETQMTAEHNAELERLKAQQVKDQRMLQDTLRKAAETHRTLEEERNQLFAEKNNLESNLKEYKRRFVAELNRELSTKHSQLGNELNTALMDVIDRINREERNTRTGNGNGGRDAERAAAGTSGNEQQRRGHTLLDENLRNPPPPNRGLLDSSGSSISVFDPCENLVAGNREMTTNQGKTPMGNSDGRRKEQRGKENSNSRRGEDQQQYRQQGGGGGGQQQQTKKRPPSMMNPILPGFSMAPPMGMGIKRKSSMMTTPSWMPSASGGRISSNQQQQRMGPGAAKRTAPQHGGPSTSAAAGNRQQQQQQAAPKFPAFQL